MPIAKIVKGDTPEGCLAYVLGKEDAVLHKTNCVSSTAAGLAHEFDLARQAQQQTQRRGRKTMNSVCHTSIAFDWEADLSTGQKLEIADLYMRGMGFEPTQNAYVIAEHHDTRHQHLHVIVSRIRWDGYTTPAWQDYQKAEAIMRQVEAEYGLKPIANSRDCEVKAPTVAEIRKHRSTGKPIPRVVIQQAIDECLSEGRWWSLAQLQAQLAQEHSITLTTKPVVLKSGAETLALLFELEGRRYSASKLGRKYSYRRLSAAMEQTELEHSSNQASSSEQPVAAEEQVSVSTRDGEVRAGADSDGLSVEAIEAFRGDIDDISAANPEVVAAEVGSSAVEPFAETGLEVDAAAAAAVEVAAEIKATGNQSSRAANPDRQSFKQQELQTNWEGSAGAEITVNPGAYQWQKWAQEQQAYQDQADTIPSERTQQDWALWRTFEAGTDRWLEQKEIAPASELDGQRRLAQVALYCRLNGYSPEQVARALMISPYGRYAHREPDLAALQWQERDKDRFAILKLMVKIDEKVWQMQSNQRQLSNHQASRN